MDSPLLTDIVQYFTQNEEILNISLDDLDRDYDIAPSTIGLDYNEICNKWFKQTTNHF